MASDDRSESRYSPPAHEVLVHFAQRLGDELGEDYAAPDVVEGLAGFMQVVAKVLADDLNRKQGDAFDNRIE